MPEYYIGTSGWSYPHWRECFYRGCARKDWLRYYAERFSSVEINGSFYRLQKTETFKKWYDQTPADFKFSLKAHRYLTHNKKLNDPEASVLIEKSRADALSDKLAVVLWQLPGRLKKDTAKLAAFIAALKQWPSAAHAVEFRHASWFADDTAQMLSDAGIAVCRSDAADWPHWDRITANPVYLRLHGRPQTYVSRYTDDELVRWASIIAERLRQGYDVHVYFDNDADGAAPDNALFLKNLLAEKY